MQLHAFFFVFFKREFTIDNYIRRRFMRNRMAGKNAGLKTVAFACDFAGRDAKLEQIGSDLG